MTSVFVVYTWRDYRRGNFVEIIDVYKDKEMANQKMEEAARRFAGINGGQVKIFTNFICVENYDDDHYFEVAEKILQG